MNTIARFLLASFVACPFGVFAQQTPLFQFTLHFRDSIGNKDTLILGFDPSATLNNLDPQFGEAVLTNPFDSVFEVRAIHPDDAQKRTLKTLIQPGDTSGCVAELGALIVINTKFPPIKITYDNTLFPLESCGNVILSTHWGIFTLPEWWDACKYHCMAGSSEYVEDFVIPPPIGFCANVLKIEKEVEGHGLKSLPGLFLATFFGPGPCNDTTFLAGKDARNIGFGTLSPNPVREHFSIQVPFDYGVQAVVRDIAGQLVACNFNISNGTAQFDASRLLPGIYFVLLKAAEGRQAVYKFVKV